jgi:hypothetical protein
VLRRIFRCVKDEIIRDMFILLTKCFSEDNTTRYWRDKQARGKLQIAEELNNGLMKIKSRLLQQILGTRYSSE